MKINIPCPNCGCQNCEAVTKTGQKVQIEICRCNDGSGEFDVAIIPFGTEERQYEKFQCPEEEIANCLTTRFEIDINGIDHQCFN